MLSKDKFAVVLKEEEKKGILGNNEKRNKIRKKMKDFDDFFAKPKCSILRRFIISRCFSLEFASKFLRNDYLNSFISSNHKNLLYLNDK